MKYDFDTVKNRTGSNCCKYDMQQKLVEYGIAERFDENTIPAFTADMDFRCADPIIDAIKRRADHGIFGYTTLVGADEYYNAIMNWFGKRYNWHFSKESIIYENGTIHGLYNALRAFTEEQDKVIIMQPVYPQFMAAINGTGRQILNCPLLNDGAGYYTIDFEKFESFAKDPKVTAFILCNPHNPVGRVWKPEELKKLSEICEANHVLIMSDDVHSDLTRSDVTYCPMSVAAPENERVVTFTAVNKTFNLAGLSITNVIIPNEELRRRYEKIQGFVVPTPFEIPAVIAAYTECDDWFDQVKEYIDGNIDWALGFLKEKLPEVICWRPEGTYVLWMDMRALGFDTKELRKRIYYDANVVLESGDNFDPEHGEGFERICVPMSRAVLKEAFERIAKALKE